MVIVACCLAACSGDNSISRTSANVSACAALARTLDGKATVEKLASLAFESDSPVAHKLRQEISTYVAGAAGTLVSSKAQHAAIQAEDDCQSIHAPVSKAYKGTG
jgi:hypothetical protein